MFFLFLVDFTSSGQVNASKLKKPKPTQWPGVARALNEFIVPMRFEWVDSAFLLIKQLGVGKKKHSGFYK